MDVNGDTGTVRLGTRERREADYEPVSMGVREPPELRFAGSGARPIYDVVGSVKGHLDCTSGEGPFFSSPDGIFSLSFFLTKARSLNLAMESGSTNHLFGHRLPTMIRFSDAAIARGSKAPNQASDELVFIRVPPGLPCLRTSCAYAAPLRSIQYIRTANFRAMATLATACPLRNFNR